MAVFFFASDLHGSVSRYEKLFDALETEAPDALLLGGDLFPHYGRAGAHDNFLEDVIAAGLERVRERLGSRYPAVVAILGNDDDRREEDAVVAMQERGLWTYAHMRRIMVGAYAVYGYNIVPPSPFLGKDWEKYDVSRYVPPASVSPEEGFRSVPVDAREVHWTTIADDLDALTGEDDLARGICLFHTPPYDTALDRIAGDGRMIDYVPLDVHVGSIAVRRFLEKRRPLIGLHGHIHESARLTGSWKDWVGETRVFSAAHDGPELALIRFSPERLEEAVRFLL